MTYKRFFDSLASLDARNAYLAMLLGALFPAILRTAFPETVTHVLDREQLGLNVVLAGSAITLLAIAREWERIFYWILVSLAIVPVYCSTTSLTMSGVVTVVLLLQFTGAAIVLNLKLFTVSLITAVITNNMMVFLNLPSTAYWAIVIAFYGLYGLEEA